MFRDETSLREMAVKTAVVHTVTYFFVGLVAMLVFNYEARFAEPALSSFMRQLDDPLVRAGVLFQPIRGVLFGILFFFLREKFFGTSGGWIYIWMTLVIVGIISTFGPAPGSIEGLVYSKVGFTGIWGGMLEVLLQSFLLSFVTFIWVRNRIDRWIGVVLWTIFVIIILMTLAGLFLA
jgi:hypothetical protein